MRLTFLILALFGIERLAAATAPVSATKQNVPPPAVAGPRPNTAMPLSPSFRTARPQHRFNRGFFIYGSYYGPWYYDPWWDYPPPPYYDYYGYSRQYIPAVPPTQMTTNVAGVSTTYTSGYRWGLDRRLRLAGKKAARKILRDWWPAAPQEARDDFRRGFIDGYGPGGAEQFDKLLEKALRQRK
jgi:hypothetical protein